MKTWLPILVFAFLWLDLIRQLSYTWQTSDQYAYGWFVPLFAAALLWRRWVDRPPAAPTQREDRSTSTFLLSAFVFLLCLSLLPLRVIHEVNQDWPLITWPLAIVVVALTLYAFHLAGPRPSPLAHRSSSVVSPWVRHFAFPVCFILVAVRWPWRIEHPVTQGLMRLDANLTVEILGWLSIPAMQHGNLIELATGTVGVDEACSGIRSFQSTLMGGLLIGELYRLRVWGRAALVGFGLLLAFGFNVVRTLILAWQAHAHGLSALDKWHDPAGIMITVVCFFCLWALATLASKRWSVKRTSRNFQLPSFATEGPRPSTLNPQPTLVCRFLFACGMWSLLTVGITETWYWSHERTAPSFLRWSVALPETSRGFERIVMPPRTRDLLACDLATAAKWEEDGGAQWTVYFIRWEGQSRKSLFASRGHHPEVCLPSAGLQKVADPQIDSYQTGKLRMLFQKSAYAAQGQPLYVFWFLWQDGDEHREGIRSVNNPTDRLVGPIEGRRRFGQQTLEIITSGYGSAAEAERAVRQRLPDLIRVEPQPAPTTPRANHK